MNKVCPETNRQRSTYRHPGSRQILLFGVVIFFVSPYWLYINVTLGCIIGFCKHLILLNNLKQSRQMEKKLEVAEHRAFGTLNDVRPQEGPVSYLYQPLTPSISTTSFPFCLVIIPAAVDKVVHILLINMQNPCFFSFPQPAPAFPLPSFPVWASHKKFQARYWAGPA